MIAAILECEKDLDNCRDEDGKTNQIKGFQRLKSGNTAFHFLAAFRYVDEKDEEYCDAANGKVDVEAS